MLKLIIEAVVFVVIMVFLSMLMIEWAVGCGESYEDAQGKIHIQDCVFIRK